MNGIEGWAAFGGLIIFSGVAYAAFLMVALLLCKYGGPDYCIL